MKLTIFARIGSDYILLMCIFISHFLSNGIDLFGLVKLVKCVL